MFLASMAIQYHIKLSTGFSLIEAYGLTYLTKLALESKQVCLSEIQIAYTSYRSIEI